MCELTITIDGPAASGKSTVGARLADRLGYLYFDTGVMYRAVTWAALERGIPVSDEKHVSKLAQELKIDVLPPTRDDGRQYTVLADGVDITWAIREDAVNEQVSLVSAYPEVRVALVRQQRRIGGEGGVVMVGRDIGTVVLPEAEIKIYLDASAQERACRRYKEMVERGQSADYERVLADLKRRDAIDSGRVESPLRPAEDAMILDSTDLDIEQVVDCMYALVEEHCDGGCGC